MKIPAVVHGCGGRLYGCSFQAEAIQKIQENEYYNALQIKFAPMQSRVIKQAQEDNGMRYLLIRWLGEDSYDDEYWRWLYTAFTRAKKLYLINFRRMR